MGHSASRVEDAHEGVAWASTVEYPDKNTTSAVIARREPSDLLYVQRTVNVIEKHQEKLSALTAGEYREVKFRLVRDPMLIGVEPSYEENDNEVLTDIGARLTIWEESFTRQKFIESLTNIVKATWLQILHIRRAIGEDPL